MSGPDEIKTWYNQLYATRGQQSMRPPEAYAPLVDLLAPTPGSTLLDVSCGSGFLLEAAQARGVHAFGVDLSDEAVRVARGVATGAGLAVCAGEQLSFRDGAFDTLTCLGSLEHFLDMDQGLREMRRVVKPGSRCVIMVPNRRFVGWWLMGGGTAQKDVREQPLALDEWRRLFTQHGFAVLAVHPDLWHAVKWRYRPVRAPLAQVAHGLMSIVWRLIPLGLQYQFIFLLARGEA
jgi:SAM-dependent methyltransferase